MEQNTFTPYNADLTGRLPYVTPQEIERIAALRNQPTVVESVVVETEVDREVSIVDAQRIAMLGETAVRAVAEGTDDVLFRVFHDGETREQTAEVVPRSFSLLSDVVELDAPGTDVRDESGLDRLADIIDLRTRRQSLQLAEVALRPAA